VIALPNTPTGYTPFIESGALVVALAACADAVRRAVRSGTLYGYAARHPARRALRGRATAYAVPLPDDATRVVVRHSRHGGVLAPLTGDRFLYPTRAPTELRTAVRLRQAGVTTPEVIAYATYPAGRRIVRCDVATREVEGGVDLAGWLATERAPEEVRSALDAVRGLLGALQRVGARHPDLNIANVLLVEQSTASWQAYVLDVDRVTFGEPGDERIGAANLQRLLRSARKQRSRGAITVTDTELATLGEMAEVVG
jgi:3-deoxy-D-manno-octulosonic acid kinase